MDDRYNRMSKLSVRTMDAFNKKAEEFQRKGKKFKRKFILVMIMKLDNHFIQRRK